MQHLHLLGGSTGLKEAWRFCANKYIFYVTKVGFLLIGYVAALLTI